MMQSIYSKWYGCSDTNINVSGLKLTQTMVQSHNLGAFQIFKIPIIVMLPAPQAEPILSRDSIALSEYDSLEIMRQFVITFIFNV